MLVLLTGLMRSGTSPTAQMIHELGISMGTYTRFPTLNHMSHYEWEDAPFGDTLMTVLGGADDGPLDSWFERYIESRDESNQHLVSPLGWGVKSPFVLPYLDRFIRAAKIANKDVKVIVTHRNFDDTLESIRVQTSHYPPTNREEICSRLVALQNELGQHLKAAHEVADLIVDFDVLQTNSAKVRADIASLLNINLDNLNPPRRMESLAWV